jgi:hypothetical protein
MVTVGILPWRNGSLFKAITKLASSKLTEEENNELARD